MLLEIALSVSIYIVASLMLRTRSLFYLKGTWDIIFRFCAFTAAYGTSALLLWGAGFPLVGVISFVVGVVMVFRKMLLDGSRF